MCRYKVLEKLEPDNLFIAFLSSSEQALPDPTLTPAYEPSDPKAFTVFFLISLRILSNMFKVGKDTEIISGFELPGKASSPKGEGFSYLYRNHSTLPSPHQCPNLTV